MTLVWGPWSDRAFHLDKMSLRDLLGAYFSYYAIQAYILVTLACIIGVAMTATSITGPLIATVVVVLACIRSSH